MKDLFKQLIIDFHRFEIPEPSPRELQIPRLPTGVRKGLVFIGMRRSGKTWSMFQQMHQLMGDGLSQTCLLYLNFEDDRLAEIAGGDLQAILDAYFELYPKHVNAKNLHFFFDEIHEVPGWEKFIRRLLDTEQIQIYISGSSAKMLSKEIATSLRGRTITREIFPFNFREYLKHRKISFPKHLSSKEKAAIVSYAQQFIRWGGFPETIDTSPSVHRELLQGYVDSVIYRDIIDRYHVTNTVVLKKLLTHCLQNASSLFSVNKVYQTLKSMGYAISKNTLYQFMTYLEDAYCIFSLDPYLPSQKKASQKPKKIYPVDQGLVTAYGWHDEFHHGARLEATIFSQLKRSHQKCFYYQTKAGQEVDFLTIDPENNLQLYQVTLSLKNENTKEREVTSLRQAMQELHLERGIIITLDETSQLSFPEGIVLCIPSWKFLLDESNPGL